MGEGQCLYKQQPMTYILTTTRLDAMGQRWVADLAKYNLQLHYQSGKLNRDVDALSRIPRDGERNLTTMDPMVMQTINTRGMQNCCAIAEDCDAGLVVHSGQVEVREAKNLNDDWKIKQDQDGDISPMPRLEKRKETPSLH